MTWKAIIKKLNNGYVIETSGGDYNLNTIIEIPDDENETRAEQIAFRNLFNKLRDFFAVFNDKHKKQYLDIKVSNTKDDN